jgi:hypothetical protein
LKSPELLPASPTVPDDVRRRVGRDYERFARDGLPDRLEDYLLQRYDLDVAAEYAGYAIPNPWGKASGQLSMTARQVEDDVRAGLGFVVLKTVIAQDETGSRSMQAWAVPESRMVAERIVGQGGEEGWTISWKGRGWWQSFDDYLQLVRDARRIAGGSGTLIVPSCKFHLPTPDESEWNVAEYEFTVRRLLEAWSPDAPQNPGISEDPRVLERQEAAMPLEKDFSPTLAGSDRAGAKSKILEWLREVPPLVKAAAGSGTVRLGLKIFNALFDDDFQLEMLRAIHEPALGSPGRADFFVYGNRLFDPRREFDGHTGIAYGGPDLSDRNLRVLSRFCEEFRLRGDAVSLPLSATGNITTGKMAVEYALRGASSFQLHTFFQLPADQYAMTAGSKTQKALHELYFHPQTGFVVWLRHVARELGLAQSPVRFLDVARQRSSV